jgi:regulator of chromosome condensation
VEEALTDEGKVFTWGCNDEGALGRAIEDGQEFTPGLVDKLSGVKIVQVAAGDSHTAALSEHGTIYGWGIFRDSNGAFGLLPPTLYSAPTNKALKITSGSDHIAFITEHGLLLPSNSLLHTH